MFILRSITLHIKDLNLTQCLRLRPWPASSSSRAGLLCPAPPPRTRARTGGRPGGWGPPCSRGAAAAGSRGRGYRGSWPPPSTRGTQGITGIRSNQGDTSPRGDRIEASVRPLQQYQTKTELIFHSYSVDFAFCSDLFIAV